MWSFSNFQHSVAVFVYRCQITCLPNPDFITFKPGLHCPDCGARWSPMAKSAGFVSTSANGEGTSVNNVTLSVFGQHRQTARKERTCLLILDMSGVNRFIGVYRVISGRERKRTQVLRDFSRGTSAIFVNVSQFIVFHRLFIGNLTHTKDPRQTHDVSMEDIRKSTFL